MVEDFWSDTMTSTAFPKKTVVWSGAILSSIATAIMTATEKLYAGFVVWDGNHYVINGVDGREGIITFDGGPWSDEGHLVGIFFSPDSDRSPFHCNNGYDLNRFFHGCPHYQRTLAEQMALPYFQDEEDGRVKHLVTAVFWDDEEHLAAADSWDDVLLNGADLIQNQLIEDRDAAFAQFQNSYGMSSEQVAFARSLFERKMARPSALIELTPVEAEWLASTSKDPKALETCRQQFHRFGISVPDVRST